MKPVKSLFLFCLAVLTLNGCKEKDKEIDAKPVTSNASFYFSAKINGQSFLVEDGENGFISSAAVTRAGVSDEEGTESQSSVLITSTLDKWTGFTLVKNFARLPGECSGIEAMFRTGSYAYGRMEDSPNTAALDGVVVFYTDANDKFWSSDLGTGNQTGSTFEIIEHVANTDGFSQKISKAKFNCKVYDGLGNSQTLTEGLIRNRSVQCDHL